jgi:hypothetical protein
MESVASAWRGVAKGTVYLCEECVLDRYRTTRKCDEVHVSAGDSERSFQQERNILKTKIFRYETTVLNKGKHLKKYSGQSQTLLVFFKTNPIDLACQLYTAHFRNESALNVFNAECSSHLLGGPAE